MQRAIIILTEGQTNPRTAKTASCMIRYSKDPIVALIDSTQIGQTAQSLLGIGGDIPVVASLDDAPSANVLLLGTAPPGGKVPPPWRAIVLDAISRGMDVTSGLHEFLTDDEEFTSAAAQHDVKLSDIRKNDESDVASCQGIREDCLRILTVGQDCSVGKMLTTVELARALNRTGQDTQFIATGQTGIMIAGDGCPIDRVIADFVSGAVEKLIKRHQHHNILMIEGQGSLVHPSYSGVSLGLLHGAMPHALIMCCEIGRETFTGLDHIRVPSLSKIIELNETMGGVFQPCPVIGISMNSCHVSPLEAERHRKRFRAEFGVPVCDVVRHGSDELVQAIVDFKGRNASSDALP